MADTLVSPVITFSMFFGGVIVGLWGRLRRPSKQGIIIAIIAVAAFLVMECIDLYVFMSFFLQNLGFAGILFNTILQAIIVFGGSWAIQKIRVRSKNKAPSTQKTPITSMLSDQDRLAKLKKMLSVSARIRQDQMREALGLDAAQFNENIWDWATEFGFKVDGDYINIGQGDVDGFIAELDKQFTNWNKGTEDKTTKV